MVFVWGLDYYPATGNIINEEFEFLGSFTDVGIDRIGWRHISVGDL